MSGQDQKKCCIDKKHFSKVYTTCLLEKGGRETCRYALEDKGIRTKEQCPHWRKPKP